MSIAAIISSPAKGNTYTIVNAMAEQLKADGKDVQVFEINAMKDRRGCQGCNACKRKGSCVTKDDLTPVLDAVRNADGIILSTPVYFGEACGQYRLLEDRFFSFLNADFSVNIAPGKKVAVVVSAGSAGADKLAEKIEGVMKNYFKCEPIGNITVTTGNDPKCAANSAEIMAKAKEIAKKF